MKKNKNQIYWIIGIIIALILIFGQGTQREGNVGAIYEKADIKLTSLGRASTVGGAECSTDYDYNYYSATGQYKSGFTQFCYTNTNHIGVVLLVFPLNADGSYAPSLRVDILKGLTGCTASVLSGKQFDYNLYYCDTVSQTCTETKEYYTDGCCDTTHIRRTRELKAITTGGCSTYCNNIQQTFPTITSCTLSTSGTTVYQKLCFLDNGVYAPSNTCGGGGGGTTTPAKLSSCKTPTVKVSGTDITAHFCIKNDGDAEAKGLIEIQPGNPLSLMSFVSPTQETCNSNYKANVHKDFTLGKGEQVEFDLVTYVNSAGNYDISALSYDSCCNTNSACKGLAPFSDNYKGITSIGKVEVTETKPAVCGNGDCEISGGENINTCPNDCTSSYCGDGYCDSKTETISCVLDCHLKATTLAEARKLTIEQLKEYACFTERPNCPTGAVCLLMKDLKTETQSLFARKDVLGGAWNPLNWATMVINFGLDIKAYWDGWTGVINTAQPIVDAYEDIMPKMEGLAEDGVCVSNWDEIATAVNDAVEEAKKATEDLTIDFTDPGKGLSEDEITTGQTGDGECSLNEFEYEGLCISTKPSVDEDLSTYELPYEEKTILEGLTTVGCITASTAAYFTSIPTLGASLAILPICGGLFKQDPYELLYINPNVPVCRQDADCESDNCIKSSKSDRATEDKQMIYEIFKDWDRIRTTKLGNVWNWITGIFSEDKILNYGLCIEKKEPWDKVITNWIKENPILAAGIGIGIFVLLIVLMSPQKSGYRRK